jgi:CopG antitoxin of type II toxin-antitoxin system
MTKSQVTEAKMISAEAFDQMFDSGEDISAYVDWSNAIRGDVFAIKRVNLDMPLHMIKRLDGAARKRGVTRQALMKMWLAASLDQAA